ncbi:MAG: HTH domain-containing protein [Haloferacaceae archaeon]
MLSWSQQWQHGTRSVRGVTRTHQRLRDGDLTVQAFVRAGVLGESIDGQFRRLRTLETAGVIDALLVRVWPAAVRLSSDDAGPDVGETEVVELYRQFAAWADRANASIEPAFAVRHRCSAITGESCDVLTTPVMGLAIYGGDGLEAVFPHRADDGTHSVADAIDALADGRFRSTAADEAPPARDDTCPECGADVVDVQGIVLCRDCTWVSSRPSTRPRPSVPGRG